MEEQNAACNERDRNMHMQGRQMRSRSSAKVEIDSGARRKRQKQKSDPAFPLHSTKTAAENSYEEEYEHQTQAQMEKDICYIKQVGCRKIPEIYGIQKGDSQYD